MSPRILLIGASGYIGNRIFNHFKNKNYNITGTYNRNKTDPELLRYDLASDDCVLSNAFTHVIIASGLHASLDDSRLFIEDAFRINVDAVIKIIKRCHELDIVPIYLSTDGVFDGKNGSYLEDDFRNPINSYGVVKKSVEDYFFENSDKRYVILRFGKAYSFECLQDTFFSEIIYKCDSTNEVICATDQIITPVEIDDVCLAIERIISCSYFGVFHIASSKPVTRFQVAMMSNNILNNKNLNIIPAKINELGLLEVRPINTSLNNQKSIEMLNLKPPEDPEYIVRRIIDQYINQKSVK